MRDADNKPVIFLAFANDRDDAVGYLRNLPDEARRLRDALAPAEQAGLCEVVVRTNSTAGDIFKVLQDPKYRNRVAILHYGGHANGYQLLLESAAGQTAAADAGGLAAFLAQQQGLHLVFLNGCSTEQQTQGLLDANISAVISTSRSIDDQVATDFSCRFYQGLAGGASVQTAYNEAEAAAQTARGGNTRGLYFGDADNAGAQLEADRWPWNLYLREGSEIAARWNLPEAVNDPLFGLPPLPEQDLPESPYRHLNRFTRKDAEVFFGRGHQIRELYDRLTAPRTAPIMLFYGQSGVGKSSILDAGLIPRLQPDHDVCYLRRTAGGLLDTLRQAFAPEASGEPIEVAWRLKEEQTGKPLIVFLDQVEELYTRPVADLPDELNQFLQVVKATFIQCEQRPRGKLVLGFRKEWLAELETHLVDYELPRTKVFLEPLDRRGIIEVVRGPTRSARLRERYGLTAEEGLAEVIADDLRADRDSAVAPTLQILLTKLWAKATEANYEQPRFHQDLYRHLHRDGILLRDFLNQQIAAFREQYPEAVDSGLLLDIVALHTTPLGTADECNIEELKRQYAHLGATLADILQRCQDLHLFTIAAGARKETAKMTRLAHDTLAPLVREQFDESDKPGQRARRILDNRSVDWQDDQVGAPLDETDLAIVERGLNATRVLTTAEQRLLEASRHQRARRARARRNLRMAAAVAVLLIFAFAAFSFRQWRVTLNQLAENSVQTLELSIDNSDELFKENILEKLKRHGRLALPHLKQVPHQPAGDSSKERIISGKQRADAAIAIAHLDSLTSAIDLLRIRDDDESRPIDPEPLTQFATRCKSRGGLSQSRLQEELKRLMKLRGEEGEQRGDMDVCYALLLALGEFDVDRDFAKQSVVVWYRNHPSPAIHSSCRWLLHEWGLESDVASADRTLAEETANNGSLPVGSWFALELTFPDEQTDIVTFVRVDDIAIATTEVTALQFAGKESDSAAKSHAAAGLSYLDAERFCEKVAGANADLLGARRLQIPDREAWQKAARAGTNSRFSFGDDEQLLPSYAVFRRPDLGGPVKVASLRPNLLGFFDVLGNAAEWCGPRIGDGANRQVYFAGGSFADEEVEPFLVNKLPQMTEGEDYEEMSIGFRLSIAGADGRR